MDFFNNLQTGAIEQSGQEKIITTRAPHLNSLEELEHTKRPRETQHVQAWNPIKTHGHQGERHDHKIEPVPACTSYNFNF
jgi:hypothetical protein